MSELSDKLTGKQKLFCEEYVIDFNATRSAKVAGYSNNTASETGYENLRKPQIQDYIKELQSDLIKTSGITKLRVLNAVKKIALDGEAENDTTMLKANEILNKMLGHNHDKETQGNTVINVTVEGVDKDLINDI